MKVRRFKGLGSHSSVPTTLHGSRREGKTKDKLRPPPLGRWVNTDHHSFPEQRLRKKFVTGASAGVRKFDLPLMH